MRSRATIRALPMFVLLGAALSACATPPPPGVAKASKSPISKAPPRLTPPETAAELHERIFDLAMSLRSPGDTDAERVEGVMGIQFSPDSQSAGKREYVGTVKEGWRYWITLRTRNNDPVPDLRFLFGEENGVYGGRCAYDLATLSEELDTAGFKSLGVLRPPGRRSWLFTKDVADTGKSFGIQMFTNAPGAGAAVTNNSECVSWIGIGYGDLRHE